MSPQVGITRGPRGLVAKLPARQQYHQFPKGARLRQRPCREYFERLVNADEHPARCCSKLRTTWAAAPDAVHHPGVWAWGSSLRAEPVSWQPCAHVGRLPPSRGSCAQTVFHTPCDASSHEKRPRVASSSLGP